MRLIYILAGIISFLAALLFTLPAEKALQWWGDDLQAEIHLYSPQGGIAYGRASSVSIDKLSLDTTRWRLRPTAFLKGRLGFSLHSGVAGQPARAIVEFGMGGKTIIHDLQASLPIAQLLPLLGPVILPVSGQLQIAMQHLVIEGEYLTEAQGEIRIQSAQWTLMRPALALGNFSARLATEGTLLIALISSDPESTLDSKGRIAVDPEGRYRIDLSVRATTSADPRLSNLLKGLGAADGQGWYHLKTSGRL